MNKKNASNRSERLFYQAQQVMPGGVSSPVRAFKSVGGVPPIIACGKGAYVYDVDGNQYIDYVQSWGPLILGHAHPDVVAAVQQAAEQGLSYGATCEIEIKLAQLICERIPSVEKIRFVNSGTEATMSALRLARGVTGRHKILKFEGCYHGHADSLLVKAGSGALTCGTPSSKGITPSCAADTLVAPYNDLSSATRLFEQYGQEMAAIIVEPVAGNMNVVLPEAGFLEGLRELCHHYQSVLIFDEVMTGFRVSAQGYQGLTAVKPDLTTLGKIIGGGMPVGAFGGKKEIMDQLAPQGEVYQAGTLSGNPLAMTAGFTTLSLLTAQRYTQLNQWTEKLMNGIRECARAHKIPLVINQCGSMFGMCFTGDEKVISFADVMNCNTERFKPFFHAMLNHGVYLAPSAFEAGFVSLAHGKQEIQHTLSAVDKALSRVCRV